jgi:hypothetical protein
LLRSSKQAHWRRPAAAAAAAVAAAVRVR